MDIEDAENKKCPHMVMAIGRDHRRGRLPSSRRPRKVGHALLPAIGF